MDICPECGWEEFDGSECYECGFHIEEYDDEPFEDPDFLDDEEI